MSPRLAESQHIQKQAFVSSEGSKLLSILIDLDQSQERNNAAMIPGIVFFLASWIAFLALLILSRLHQFPSLYTNYTTKLPWFDKSDAIFIILPFLLPAIAVAVTTLLEWQEVRYRKQAYALNKLLHNVDDAMTPILTMSQADPSISSVGTYKNINLIGWQTSRRHYRLNRLLLKFMFVVLEFALTLVNLSQGYGTPKQMIDTITPVVIIFLIILILIFMIRELIGDRRIVKVNEWGGVAKGAVAW